jgi:hypothetical protein
VVAREFTRYQKFQTPGLVPPPAFPDRGVQGLSPDKRHPQCMMVDPDWLPFGFQHSGTIFTFLKQVMMLDFWTIPKMEKGKTEVMEASDPPIAEV